MALLKGTNLPVESQDAYYIIESGCHPTLEEIDHMPQKLLDTLLLYKGVKLTIQQGGEMRL